MNQRFPGISKSLKTRCLQLTKSKYRIEYRQLLIEGTRIISDALDTDVNTNLCVIDESCIEKHHTLLNKITQRQIPIYTTNKREFESFSSTIHSQGICAITERPSEVTPDILRSMSSPAVAVVLVQINDPGNLGTIIRTCDWFGVHVVFISKGSVDIYNPKVVRSTMGSLFRISFCQYDSFQPIADLAHDCGYRIFAADAHSQTSVKNIVMSEKSLIIFGSEAHGIPENYSACIDRRIAIPKFGHAESLNVAVSVGILLSEFTRQSVQS